MPVPARMYLTIPTPVMASASAVRSRVGVMVMLLLPGVVVVFATALALGRGACSRCRCRGDMRQRRRLRASHASSVDGWQHACCLNVTNGAPSVALWNVWGAWATWQDECQQPRLLPCTKTPDGYLTRHSLPRSSQEALRATQCWRTTRRRHSALPFSGFSAGMGPTQSRFPPCPRQSTTKRKQASAQLQHACEMIYVYSSC